MRDIIISASAVALLLATIPVLAFIYLREDKGKHGENANVYRPRPLVSDDTVKLSSFDRRRYIEAQERMANTAEQDFTHAVWLASEESWPGEIQAIFAESHLIDRYLDSGALAFPEWIWSSAA